MFDDTFCSGAAPRSIGGGHQV